MENLEMENLEMENLEMEKSKSRAEMGNPEMEKGKSGAESLDCADRDPPRSSLKCEYLARLQLCKRSVNSAQVYFARSCRNADNSFSKCVIFNN